MDRLREAKLLELVDGFDQQTIGPGDDFFVVLDGSDDLPSEILRKGNFLILNRPDLLNQELLVTAMSQTNGAMVQTTALLGLPANTRVPEPVTLSLLAIGALALIRRRR